MVRPMRGGTASWIGTALTALAVGSGMTALPAVAQEPTPRSGTPDDLPETEALRDAIAEAARLERQRELSETEVQRLSETIRLTEERRRALEDAVAAIEGDAAALRNEAVRAAERRERAEAAIGAIAERLALLGAREETLLLDLAARREVMADVLAALQRVGRNPPPALLVRPDDALAAARSASLLGAVVPELREQAERLVVDLEALRSVREETVAERDRLRQQVSDAAEAEQRVALLTDAKRDALRRAGRDLEAERRRAAELAGRATTLEELTATLDRDLESAQEAAREARLAVERAKDERERERLEAERVRREAEREAAVAAADALRRAREDAERSALAPAPDAPDQAPEPPAGIAPPGVFASADPSREAPAFAFSSLQSKLRLPLANGRVVRGFGGATRGLVVAADAGAPVRAPTDGWVLYVGPFRSYGEIVILNVGDDYRMVLAGLDSAGVALGQFVLAGEPVGKLGAAAPAAAVSGGALDGAALYVEVREGSRTIDPARWFAPEVADAGG